MILIIFNPNISSKEQFEEDIRHLEETNLSLLFLDRVSSLKTGLFRRKH